MPYDSAEIDAAKRAALRHAEGSTSPIPQTVRTDGNFLTARRDSYTTQNSLSAGLPARRVRRVDGPCIFYRASSDEIAADLELLRSNRAAAQFEKPEIVYCSEPLF